jgi:hypothetical protein
LGRLFISHASADKLIADALADLLRLGADLPRARILCTSLPGMGIPEGESDYIAYLRRELRGAVLVLPLLTPAFFESEVCLVELGAMWGMELPAFPIVVPPSTFAEVEAILGKVQCARIDSPGGLARLRDRVMNEFRTEAPTDLWEEKHKQFMIRWQRLRTTLAGPTRVSARDHEKSLKEIESLKSELAELGEALDETRDRLDDVAALKDREQVAPLLASRNERSHFDELATEAAHLTDDLPPVVREAMYENIGRNAPFCPEEADMGEADNAVRQDRLSKNDSYDDEMSGYWINEDDPEVGAAADAIRALFDQSWSDELLESIRGEYNKNFSRSSRPIWRALRIL